MEIAGQLPNAEVQRPNDFYRSEFVKVFPQPVGFKESGEPLIKAHIEQVLNASNAIREHIVQGDWDELSAEEVFHTMHDIHVGGTDPVKNVLATMDLGLLESSGSYSVWYEAVKAADHLGRDTSYKKGQYRTTPIQWGERGRGVLGINEKDLPAFANDFFSKLNSLIEQVKAGAIPELRQPENALGLAVAAGSIIDIAHFKKDCNGRTAEDFTVWLQKQLLPDGEKQTFLSDNGLRARGAELVVKPDYEEMFWNQRMRIDNRGESIINIRKTLYSNLAQTLGMSIEQIEQAMPLFTYDQTVYDKQQEIKHKATAELQKITGVLDDWKLSQQEPFSGVVNYFRNAGVHEYHEYSSEEVFK